MYQAPPTAIQSAFSPHLVGDPSGKGPLSNAGFFGSNQSCAQPPGEPSGDPDDDLNKTKRDKDIDFNRNGISDW